MENLRNAGVGQVDRVSPTDRVTAPGFADMFEKFVKGVDQKKKVSTQQTQDLILGGLIISMKRWLSRKKPK